MALPNPAADLRDYLNGLVAGTTTLTRATNLFAGRQLSDELMPAAVVCLLNTGGMAPAPYMGPERSSYYQAAVQVLVRGPARNLEAGEALARGVLGLLHQATVSGYVQVLARDSAPVLLDVDSAGRGVWACNVDAHFTAALA